MAATEVFDRGRRRLGFHFQFNARIWSPQFRCRSAPIRAGAGLRQLRAAASTAPLAKVFDAHAVAKEFPDCEHLRNPALVAKAQKSPGRRPCLLFPAAALGSGIGERAGDVPSIFGEAIRSRAGPGSSCRCAGPPASSRVRAPSAAAPAGRRTAPVSATAGSPVGNRRAGLGGSETETRSTRRRARATTPCADQPAASELLQDLRLGDSVRSAKSRPRPYNRTHRRQTPALTRPHASQLSVGRRTR